MSYKSSILVTNNGAPVVLLRRPPVAPVGIHERLKLLRAQENGVLKQRPRNALGARGTCEASNIPMELVRRRQQVLPLDRRALASLCSPAPRPAGYLNR